MTWRYILEQASVDASEQEDPFGSSLPAFEPVDQKTFLLVKQQKRDQALTKFLELQQQQNDKLYNNQSA